MILKALFSSMELYRRSSGIPEGKLEAFSETREQLLIQIRRIPFFVALLPDGTVVGSVRLKSIPIEELLPSFAKHPFLSQMEEGQSVGYFSRFSVLPEMHNLGIGGKLYLAAEDEARRSGYAGLCLHTAITNEAMVAFYRRRGFVLLQTDSSRGYERGLFAKIL
jgi:ribosomal protein S18 acetylase RimI-like enzyme